MMKVGQVPFHRILTGSQTPEDNVKSIDKIDTEDDGSGRYLASRNECKRRNHISEKHRARIPDNTGTPRIIPPEDKECWEKNREK